MTATLRDHHERVLALQESIQRWLRYGAGCTLANAPPAALLDAVSLAVREAAIDRMLETEARVSRADAKRVFYLSMEFLIGRSLGSNLRNLGLDGVARDALARLGIDLADVEDREPDAALGNGGLGRLAACYLDSLASLDLPGYGYSLNYEFGLFRQVFMDGHQHERPDAWRLHGSPWLLPRPHETCFVPVYGRIVHEPGHDGRLQPLWLDWGALIGVPWDLPVVGYGGNTVNWLRLFTARPASDFDVQTFNRGDYRGAVEQSLFAERISKLLYPADSFEAGRELRLLQEYFLVACAIRDIVRRWLATHDGFDGFAEKNAIQLNDTHPTLAVPEFLRLLIDEHGLPWEKAWQITHATFAYTNHTLMAEALERWSVPLLAHVLPRHLQIIQEINRIFLEEVSARFPGDLDRTRRVSIIEESQPQQVRMANLAIVGSHAVNGVAKLHSELVRRDLVPDLAEMWPERFLNVTNGVTPRRWILGANPALAELVSTRIGAAWITDLDRFLALEPAAEDPDFRERFRQVKRRNKERLGALVENLTGVAADPGALFDVQIKRIHEYKRQLLAAMHLIDRYYAIVEDGEIPKTPRLHLFAGKAAPEYHVAKLVIRLVNGISRAIAAEPRCRDVLSVAFLPDYRVSLAERIVPAADLSEQISTAGKEASGTGNMKLALNGALTIGTLDGANVEIAECVGEENIYVFGLRVEQVEALLRSGEHHPTAYLETHPRLRRVLHALCGDRFCPGQPGLFGPLFDRLVHEGDPYLHLADFDAYQAAQARVDVDYLDADDWSRRAILNVARCGRFSSDRAIREYAERIWQIKAVP